MTKLTKRESKVRSLLSSWSAWKLRRVFRNRYWMNILHFEYRGAPVNRVHGRCECYTGQGVVGIAKSTLKVSFLR
jgi:hypothetical protein